MARGDREHTVEYLIIEAVDRQEWKQRGDVRRDALLSYWVEAQAMFAYDRLRLRHLDKQHGVSGCHAARVAELAEPTCPPAEVPMTARSLRHVKRRHRHRMGIRLWHAPRADPLWERGSRSVSMARLRSAQSAVAPGLSRVENIGSRQRRERTGCPSRKTSANRLAPLTY